MNAVYKLKQNINTEHSSYKIGIYNIHYNKFIKMCDI